MIRNLLGASILFCGYAPLALSSAPTNACRAKLETIEQHGTIVSDAGCVIEMSKGKERKYLLVYVDKGEGKKGWGFPAGSQASRTEDLEVDEDTGSPTSVKTTAIAKTVEFDYSEPAICTAARETREETGSEVIIGDLISTSPKFTAFRCTFTNPMAAEQSLVPEDQGEVLQIGWFSVEQMQEDGFFRFPDNLDIIERNETMD